MSTPPADTSAYAIELDEHQSGRLLEHATRTGADISVVPHTRADGLPIAGAITGSTGDGLLLSTRSAALSDPASLVSVYCEATVSLDGARFLFSTNILDACRDGDDLRIEIARPAHLHVIQRRRYQRRRLRGRTRVWITPGGCEDQRALEATLLNISTGGLACRMDQAGADLCAIEHPVHLEFTIADCEETFHMPAHGRSKTPGASPGQVIFSLEFARGAETETQRERLADALYANLVALTAG